MRAHGQRRKGQERVVCLLIDIEVSGKSIPKKTPIEQTKQYWIGTKDVSAKNQRGLKTDHVLTAAQATCYLGFGICQLETQDSAALSLSARLGKDH